MRVLMTTDTVGGVWTYSQELTRGLLARGCKVTLLSMGRQPSSDQKCWVSKTAALWPDDFTCIPTDFKLEWMQDGIGCYEESSAFVLSCAAASHAQLLHSNQFCYGSLPLDIPKIVVAHSDVLSWSIACRGHLPAPSAWSDAYRRMVLSGLEAADAIVCPTEWMRREILRHYQPSSRSTVIPNGRSVTGPAGPRKIQAITCGRLWDEGKNIRILQDLDLAMPLMIAGETEFEEQVDWRPHKLKLLGKLTEEELLQRFSESAVYIATSRYEPFGLAPLEAALCGCAILANDIPSLREVWGEAALYFEQNNKASLSAALAELSREPMKLQEASLAAYTRAADIYSGDRMTAQYLDLYRELAADRAKYAA